MILAAPPYDMTAALVAELNVLVPSAQINPPPGWQPARVRQQQQQQQQGAAPQAAAPRPAVPAPKPAGPQPEGR